MKWMHKCNLGWIKARQSCLTASDIIELIPVTKTGRKRTITDETYLKVYARKLVTLTEDDCVSTGAAARGHVLEPYAINLYNNVYATDTTLHHWDDVVVTRRPHEHLGLAFSPDAMDVPIPELNLGIPFVSANDDMKIIGEVKCYDPKHHMICGYTNKADLEERWQVATAMAVSNSIEQANIIFYNPSMDNQMYIAEYNRDDLAKEIEMILDVEQNWLSWLKDFDKLDKHYLIKGTGWAEQDIIRDIIKKEELNPEGERSVIL